MNSKVIGSHTFNILKGVWGDPVGVLIGENRGQDFYNAIPVIIIITSEIIWPNPMPFQRNCVKCTDSHNVLIKGILCFLMKSALYQDFPPHILIWLQQCIIIMRLSKPASFRVIRAPIASHSMFEVNKVESSVYFILSHCFFVSHFTRE